jgi:hypothetical protein
MLKDKDKVNVNVSRLKAQRLKGSTARDSFSSPLLFHLTASHAPTRFTPPSIAAALHWLAGAMQCHYSRVAVRVWRKTDRQGKCPRQIRTVNSVVLGVG